MIIKQYANNGGNRSTTIHINYKKTLQKPTEDDRM